MEPKPVISYFGDQELIGSVLQKKLQPRFKALQLSSLPKDDPPCSAFSAICNGVEFTPLSTIEARAKAGPLPLHQRPALHTFWTASSDVDSYRTHARPLIAQWLGQLEQLADGAECLIVYCVTAEVRAKRHRTMSTITGSVDEKIRGDFRGNDVFLLRLASSDENRVIESFQAFTARANQMCLAKFHKDIEKEAESVVAKRERRTEPEDFYNVFLQKVNLAVVYELTLSHEEALQLYSEASSDLEESLAMYGSSESPPGWLEAIRNAPCNTWDYPKLVWSQLAWRYLPAITGGTSPLLHTQTFLLMRLCHLLFLLERGWTVSELCISTLHCMARQITALNLSLPEGAFNCWAYMTCQEAVLSIMARISADSVVSATSSLLLVRAELWHYALQKLHAIGVLCELMPSCNVQNHDFELVKRITDGITPVPVEVDATRDPMEDEGKKLIEILNSSQVFRTAYLTLGEMVVGAFKHAGRRRMAFCVGTMMAQFHRDMGLVHEAEQLLSDICRFYSEDHWVQLSTKTYSLLADCQKKLKMEDKHVSTMLLLTSFPPYPGAAHDPNRWFDNLMEIAKHSHYQKLLAWDPLLEMAAIRLVGGEGRGHSTEDTIRMELVFRYHGPKVMKPIFISLLLRACVGDKRSSPSQPLEQAPSSPIHVLSDVAIGNLEELDLESDSSRLPHSRPIGYSKTRTTSNVVTMISSSDLADQEVGGAGEDWRSKVPEFMLTVQGVALTPGENRILVEGKPRDSGRYLPHKVNLKCGALDFLLEDPKFCLPVAVLASRVDVGVSLEPELGEFLAGYPLECVLKLKTGRDTSIPEGARVRMLTSDALQCTVQDSTIRVNRAAGTAEASFTLPAIAEDSEYSTPLTLTVPSTKVTPARDSLVGGAESCDSADQSESCSWLHEVQVFCDWLSPVHTAVLSLTVYDPLTVTHKEHTAGENTFLQLFLCNPSPLPISLGTSMLAADIELSRLHSELPEVLYPGESYSCVWKVAPGPPAVGDMTPASFHVQFRPLSDGKDMPMKEFHYEFRLSNMRTIYEVRASVEPMKEHTRVTTRRSAFLKFDIRNVAKSRFTTKLRYDVTVDGKMWKLQAHPWGVIEAPKPGQLTQLMIKAMPLVGLVELPTLTLSQYLVDINPKGTHSPVVSGRKELNASDDKYIPLSSAQVYNLSLGDVVSIATVQLAS